MFKVGDKVRVIRKNCTLGGHEAGTIGEITSQYTFLSNLYGNLYGKCWVIKSGDGVKSYYAKESDLELISNNEPMNIKEKFVLALTKEPQKSFRKAGITNGDDLLTDEGQKIFLSWLLHSKFADEFKKDVVENLLEDDKENK